MELKYGVYVAPFGELAHASELAALATQAEEAGWDGFFIYDHVAREGVTPIADPWIALAAIAERTSRIRIGAMVTPLARRRPWKVARETASLDQLSGGRLIFGAGLGHRREEFEAFGEERSAQVRAAMLDEALQILIGLWRGESFTYDGAHYQIRDALFLPTPVQSPRIPIWIAGRWPHHAPFRRAANWDGAFPLPAGEMDLTPKDLGEIRTYVSDHRESRNRFDMVQLGITNPGEERPDLLDYAKNGVTWWLEDIHPRRFGAVTPAEGIVNAMRRRVRNGPPTVQSS